MTSSYFIILRSFSHNISLLNKHKPATVTMNLMKLYEYFGSDLEKAKLREVEDEEEKQAAPVTDSFLTMVGDEEAKRCPEAVVQLRLSLLIQTTSY
jgi:hypothetical protein